MIVIAGLQLHADSTSIDFGAGIDAFMCHTDDIAAVLSDDAAYSGELSGLVGKVNDEGVVATALAQTAGDDAA